MVVCRRVARGSYGVGVFVVYKASVSNLFNLAILLETERSMVLSPISTTRPPMISVSICVGEMT